MLVMCSDVQHLMDKCCQSEDLSHQGMVCSGRHASLLLVSLYSSVGFLQCNTPDLTATFSTSVSCRLNENSSVVGVCVYLYMCSRVCVCSEVTGDPEMGGLIHGICVCDATGLQPWGTRKKMFSLLVSLGYRCWFDIRCLNQVPISPLKVTAIHIQVSTDISSVTGFYSYFTDNIGLKLILFDFSINHDFFVASEMAKVLYHH